MSNRWSAGISFLLSNRSSGIVQNAPPTFTVDGTPIFFLCDPNAEYTLVTTDYLASRLIKLGINPDSVNITNLGISDVDSMTGYLPAQKDIKNINK